MNIICKKENYILWLKFLFAAITQKILSLFFASPKAHKPARTKREPTLIRRLFFCFKISGRWLRTFFPYSLHIWRQISAYVSSLYVFSFSDLFFSNQKVRLWWMWTQNIDFILRSRRLSLLFHLFCCLIATIITHFFSSGLRALGSSWLLLMINTFNSFFSFFSFTKHKTREKRYSHFHNWYFLGFDCCETLFAIL